MTNPISSRWRASARRLALPELLWVLGSVACSSAAGDPSGDEVSGIAGSGGVPSDVPIDKPIVENPPDVSNPDTLNPGFILAKRLNNTEYNNTLRDLLGTTLRPGDFIQATTVTGFDTNATALAGINTAMASGYFDAARDLVEDVFGNAALRTALTGDCADASCVQAFVESFGAKAYRRPLTADEVQRLVSIYSDAIATLELDHVGALEHITKIMLLSPHFLYRLEVDPDIAGAVQEKRPLSAYELASRLSYTLWSAMPDAALMELAGSGELLEIGRLQSEVERMINDQRGRAFIDDFFGQWFSTRQLASHQVDTVLYSSWNDGMRGAMLEDANRFFTTFVTGGRAWTELLTAPLDTGNAALSDIYANDPSPRTGFLGLPAFLTLTSRAERTAPTFRGRVALEAVLCNKVEVPANLQVPDLVEAGGEAVDITNVREKLEEHRKDPLCSTCHQILDPIGLGLENYDAIGRYRASYENGDTIDASGELQGKPFNGSDGLAGILNADARFAPCPSKMLMSYSLSRILVATDKPYAEQITAAWNGGNITDLVKQFVVNDTFRFRKLPPEAL
jgi:hypothetical protein